MIAKQTVFLTHDRKSAVPEGHKDARYLLAREGSEIEPGHIEDIDGAEDLVGSARKGAVAERTESHAGSSVPKLPAKKAAKKASAAKK